MLDTLNRLTNAAYSDGSRESYSYDKVGNRLTRITLAPTVQRDTVSPSVPSGLAAEVRSPTERHLVWNRALDTGGSGLAGYFIYMNDQLYGTAITTNLVLPGLALDTLYSVTISSFDKASNVSSPSSPLVFFIPSNGNTQSPLLTGLVASNEFVHLTLFGIAGSNYIVEASSNLFDWLPVFTNSAPLEGLPFIFYSDIINHAQRFYRAQLSAKEPVELIVNGSFEIPIPGIEELGHIKLFPGDPRLSGWTVGGNGGPVVCGISGANAADGTNDLNFNSNNDHSGTWIEQTFRTVPGVPYQLTFSAGRTGNGGSVRLQTFMKSQTNELLGSDEFSPPGQGYSPPRTINFTAASETTIVTFLDDSPDTVAVDLLLDNVSVSRLAL